MELFTGSVHNGDQIKAHCSQQTAGRNCNKLPIHILTCPHSKSVHNQLWFSALRWNGIYVVPVGVSALLQFNEPWKIWFNTFPVLLWHETVFLYEENVYLIWSATNTKIIILIVHIWHSADALIQIDEQQSTKCIPITRDACAERPWREVPFQVLRFQER